jgi:hypothetical protein
MTFEAPDLSQRLSRRHFFCACLYSLPRPGLLPRIVPSVSVLIRSPYRFVHVILYSFAPPVLHSVSRVSTLIRSPCRVV